MKKDQKEQPKLDTYMCVADSNTNGVNEKNKKKISKREKPKPFFLSSPIFSASAGSLQQRRSFLGEIRTVKVFFSSFLFRFDISGLGLGFRFQFRFPLLSNWLGTIWSIKASRAIRWIEVRLGYVGFVCFTDLIWKFSTFELII